MLEFLPDLLPSLVRQRRRDSRKKRSLVLKEVVQISESRFQIASKQAFDCWEARSKIMKLGWLICSLQQDSLQW